MECKCEICRDNGNKCEEPAGSMYLNGVGYVCDKCAQEYPEDCIIDSESEPDKIPQGEPVPRPDYEIKSYRVKYICIDCPTMFDNFTSVFDVTVSEQNAIITSADYFRETLDDLLNDDEADKDFVDIVKRILKDIEKFDGDVWVYSRN